MREYVRVMRRRSRLNTSACLLKLRQSCNQRPHLRHNAVEHVVPRLLEATLERAFKREHVGAAVALDDEASQAEQARAVVAARIDCAA